MNYLAYDVANFLNETTIDYAVGGYPGFRLVRKLTFAEISELTRFYPGYYAELEIDVLKCMCVANLFWAYWCLKRFHVNIS